jgi:hypothetical protein
MPLVRKRLITKEYGGCSRADSFEFELAHWRDVSRSLGVETRMRKPNRTGRNRTRSDTIGQGFLG